MTRPGPWSGYWLVAWVLSGCAAPDLETEPLWLGPMDVYVNEVQPVVSERCSAGGCHGRPERPLSLYEPGTLRLDPDRTYLDEPLSQEELERNARRLAAFAHGMETGDSLTVCKPLAQPAGGCWHGAEDIFIDSSDPGYQALAGWLDQREAMQQEAP